uniref:NADH dehydrogenase subunit 4L n=1 Tax=Anaka burmensis TaxID=2026963 RepID=UPI002551F6AD|nr:NADH dehydrogenase subunit 4L [Anaka burmensis]UNZ99519.1 NADH dehydrogenase subunit 4L [Anaka burmensis]
MWIFYYMLLLSLISMILIRKHILLCLMSLELIVLVLLLMIMTYCIMMNYSMYLFVIMMTFYVCEGVLGLSVLVYMIRCHGNDLINSLMMW